MILDYFKEYLNLIKKSNPFSAQHWINGAICKSGKPGNICNADACLTWYWTFFYSMVFRLWSDIYKIYKRNAQRAIDFRRCIHIHGAWITFLNLMGWHICVNCVSVEKFVVNLLWHLYFNVLPKLNHCFLISLNTFYTERNVVITKTNLFLVPSRRRTFLTA